MKRVMAAVVVMAAAWGGGIVAAGSATGAAAAPMPREWLKTETTLIGHKGAVSTGVRNTLTAMNGAFRLGADGIEFDVVRTKDNEPVVLSDTRLDVSTKNCTGLTTQRTYAQVRKCVTLDGKRVPNIYEALMVARDHRGQAWIHLKVEDTNPLVATRIVRAINKYGMNRKGMVTVFSDQKAMLEELRKRGVGRIALIFNNGATQNWNAKGYHALVVYNSPLPIEKVRAAQARGVEVVAVERHPLSAAAAIALGVDAVIMDNFAAVGR